MGNYHHRICNRDGLAASFVVKVAPPGRAGHSKNVLGVKYSHAMQAVAKYILPRELEHVSSKTLESTPYSLVEPSIQAPSATAETEKTQTTQPRKALIQ